MLKNREIISLIVNVICVKLILTFPSMMIENSGNAAWIQCVYVSILGVLLFWATYRVYQKKKNVIELAEEKGTVWRVITGLIVMCVLISNLTSVIRIFPETVKIILLQNFHSEVLIILCSITIAIGAYMGIEAIGRIHSILMPIAGVLFVLLFIMLLKYFRFTNITPIFGKGYKEIFVNGLKGISFFSDILLLNLLLPYCKNINNAKKNGLIAIVISATILIVTILSYCLIYPYPATEYFILPVYEMTRIINLSSFFNRFEALFEMVWAIVILLYGSIYIYILTYVWQKTFHLKYNKPLIAAVTIICTGIALLPKSIISAINIEEMMHIATVAIVFGLPLIWGMISKKVKK